MMVNEAIAEGASVEEALDAALEQLGVQQDAVDYEVLEAGGRGLFGMGSERMAKVKVWLRSGYLSEQADEDAEGVLPKELEAAASVEPRELTDEQLDAVADVAMAAVREVLDSFGIEATIEEYEGDEGEIILDVVGGDLGVLIGRHGRTLDSLQILVAAITNRHLGYRYPVLVDVEGYRIRRKAQLEEIAARAADRACRQSGAVRLRPMSAYERRVVHMNLRNDSRVITESDGEEPFRSVVVKPKARQG